MQVIDLTAAPEFTPDGLGHNAIVIFQHIGLNGLTLKGRLLDGAHVPDAGKRHVERAGNRRGAQRQHIHADEILFEFFLVAHAEPLLLVNDDKPQIAELYIIREQPVGSDHNIHGAVLQPAQRFLLFPRTAVAGEQPDADGKRLHPRRGGVEVLPRQDGGRGQNRTLLAAHHALESCAQGNLGFANAHIAAEQPVHRPGLFHVVLDFGGGRQLVSGLLIGEPLLKIVLPCVIRREGIAGRLLAPGIQLNQFLRHRLGSGLDFAAGFCPFGTAQTAQLDIVGIAGGGVAGQKVKLGDGNIEHVFFVILNAQVILGDTLHGHPLDACVPSDAVVLVHHQIAGRDLGQAVERILVFLVSLFAADALAKSPPRQHCIARKGKLASG